MSMKMIQGLQRKSKSMFGSWKISGKMQGKKKEGKEK